MSLDASAFLWGLGRTTFCLTMCGLVSAVMLRVTGARWPALHRCCWAMPLLVGWTFFRLSVGLPWPGAPLAALPVVAPDVPPDSLPERDRLALQPNTGSTFVGTERSFVSVE